MGREREKGKREEGGKPRAIVLSWWWWCSGGGAVYTIHSLCIMYTGRKIPWWWWRSGDFFAWTPCDERERERERERRRWPPDCAGLDWIGLDWTVMIITHFRAVIRAPGHLGGHADDWRAAAARMITVIKPVGGWASDE
jgi:hypothetical protein